MHRRSSTSLNTKGVWVCMALTLVFQLTQSTPTQRSRPLLSHHLTKRAFADQQCKGVYDKSIYARLDRICEDCYNLFREPEIHGLCKKNCFKTPNFQACIDAFNLGDDEKKIFIRWLNKSTDVDYREECFTNDYFKACLDTLQLQDEIEQIQIWIKQLHGAEPGV